MTASSLNVGYRSRVKAAAILAALLVPFANVSAYADCQDDIAKVMKHRLSEVEKLNAIAKSNGGKLNPIQACPQLRTLAAVEGEAEAYMVKNKEWCNLPDDFVSKMSASHVRTVNFAQQACSAVVKMKQMMQQHQQQQAQQNQEQAQKLPSGPL